MGSIAKCVNGHTYQHPPIQLYRACHCTYLQPTSIPIHARAASASAEERDAEKNLTKLCARRAHEQAGGQPHRAQAGGQSHHSFVASTIGYGV